MKKMNIILLILLSLIGCDQENNNKDENSCYVKNPINELAWLKKIVDEQSTNNCNKMIIKNYKYNDKDGFLIDYCVGCADGLSTYYDCSGNVICEFGGIDGKNTCPDFSTKAVEGEMVFIDTIVQNKIDSSICGYNKPLTSLSWLKKIVETYSKEFSNKIEIYQCSYNCVQGFLINWCVNCPDGLTQFISCDSVVMCEFGGIMGTVTCPDFDKKTTNKKLLWNN